MKRILTVATVVIVTAFSAYSQTEIAKVNAPACTLKPSQAPAVRGIKVGMTVEDLLALFPGSAAEEGVKLTISKADNYPNFGVMRMDIAPNRYATKERFAGIAYFNFVILDGRVAQYQVDYSGAPNGPTWLYIDDFIAKIAEALHLPASPNWIPHEQNSSTKELRCDGFQIRVSNVSLRGSLTVATVDAPFKIQKERLAAFEAKGRRDFRP